MLRFGQNQAHCRIEKPVNDQQVGRYVDLKWINLAKTSLAYFRSENCIAIKKLSWLFWRLTDSANDSPIAGLCMYLILSLSDRPFLRKLDSTLISRVSRRRKANLKFCLTVLSSYIRTLYGRGFSFRESVDPDPDVKDKLFHISLRNGSLMLAHHFFLVLPPFSTFATGRVTARLSESVSVDLCCCFATFGSPLGPVLPTLDISTYFWSANSQLWSLKPPPVRDMRVCINELIFS